VKVKNKLFIDRKKWNWKGNHADAGYEIK